MAELLPPVEEKNRALMEEKNESVGVNMQNDDGINIEAERVDLTRSDDKTIKLG